MQIEPEDIACVEALIERVMLEYYRENPEGEDITPIEFASRILTHILSVIDTINKKKHHH